jgi:hypothetical protein
MRWTPDFRQRSRIIGDLGRDRTCDPKFRKLELLIIVGELRSSLCTFLLSIILLFISLGFSPFLLVSLKRVGKTWGLSPSKIYQHRQSTSTSTSIASCEGIIACHPWLAKGD